MLRSVSPLAVVLGLALLAGCNPAHLFTEDEPGGDPVARLIDDLEARGVVALREGSVWQPFLSGDGHVLRVAGEAVHVFVYVDADAAEREAAGISPDGSAFTSTGAPTMVTWIAPPHLFRRDRIIVLYLGETATILTTLESVLGAPFASR